MRLDPRSFAATAAHVHTITVTANPAGFVQAISLIDTLTESSRPGGVHALITTAPELIAGRLRGLKTHPIIVACTSPEWVFADAQRPRMAV